jgi:hypothetical protein
MKKNLLQIITIVLALIAIGAAYNIYLISRPVKTIQIEIDTASPLVNVRPEASGTIQILYNGLSISNPELLQIKIKNTGNQPIVASDYSRPLLFSFEPQDQIISVSVVNSQPSNIDLTINKSAANQATVTPTLLNPGDIVTVRFIVAEYANDPIEDHFHFDGRIVGIQEIDFVSIPNQQQSESRTSLLLQWIAVLIGLIGLLIVIIERGKISRK